MLPVILLLGLALLPFQAPLANAQTVLILGDSISAAYGIQREDGWVNLLQQRLANARPGTRVVNASVSGETTGGGLARLPAALAEHRPAIVVVELGGNDGLRGYPVKRARDNLAAMIDLVRGAGARPLLVGMRIPPNYGARYTQAFERMYADLADATQVPLVPFLLASVALNPALMQGDGIHPTAAAQPALLDTIWPFIDDLLHETAGAG
ncbi:MAG: arylesterase [Pseudomonadales bacterium]